MSTKLYSDEEIYLIFTVGVMMGLHHVHKGNGVSKLKYFLNIILSEEVQKLIHTFITKDFNIEADNITSDEDDDSLNDLLIIEEMQEQDDQKDEEKSETAKQNNVIDIYALD